MRAAQKTATYRRKIISPINQLSVIAKGFDSVFDSLEYGKVGDWCVLVDCWWFWHRQHHVCQRFGTKSHHWYKESSGRQAFRYPAGVFYWKPSFLCMMGAVVGLALVYVMCHFATDATGYGIQNWCIKCCYCIWNFLYTWNSGWNYSGLFSCNNGSRGSNQK
jgi:hypothetical protein